VCQVRVIKARRVENSHVNFKGNNIKKCDRQPL
jgi:hypothetical protein